MLHRVLSECRIGGGESWSLIAVTETLMVRCCCSVRWNMGGVCVLYATQGYDL